MRPIFTLLAATVCLFALLVCSVGFAAGDEPQSAKKTVDKIKGAYKIVSGEKDGKVIPPDEIKGAMTTFTGDTIVGTDKDKKMFFSATYTLDESSSPIQINMVAREPKTGDKVRGVIEVSGDMVRICYPVNGGPVPTDFKTKENQHMFVLKRVE